jgi:uncharacterized protein (DUF983 family)
MSNPWEHLDPEPRRDPDPHPEPENETAGGPERTATPVPGWSPEPPTQRPSSAKRRGEPGATKAFLRGATKRCPRCGAGGLFSSWFRIRERCPRCGLRLEREEGGFLGAITLNYAATAVAWVALLVVWLVVDLPDLHVGALTIASIAVAVFVPLLFWPLSKTIWAAVDYLIYRTSPDYGSREAADRARGNGGRH